VLLRGDHVALNSQLLLLQLQQIALERRFLHDRGVGPVHRDVAAAVAVSVAPSMTTPPMAVTPLVASTSMCAQSSRQLCWTPSKPCSVAFWLDCGWFAPTRLTQ